MSGYDIIEENVLLCKRCKELSNEMYFITDVFGGGEGVYCGSCLAMTPQATLLGLQERLPRGLIEYAREVSKGRCQGCHGVFKYKEIGAHAKKCSNERDQWIALLEEVAIASGWF